MIGVKDDAELYMLANMYVVELQRTSHFLSVLIDGVVR